MHLKRRTDAPICLYILTKINSAITVMVSKKKRKVSSMALASLITGKLGKFNVL